MNKTQLIALGAFLGIILGIMLDILSKPVEYVRANEEATTTPKIVQIEADIKWTPARIEKEIRQAFPEDADTMVRVAKCEGGLVPDAVNPTNGSYDKGVFQISQKHHGAAMRELKLDPFNPRDNIKYARILYEQNHLSDWRASKFCWLKK